MKYLMALALLCCGLCSDARSYFQQRVDMKIDVRLDDRTHFLHGFEEISYRNQSPDTLRFIYLHLWPNAYSSDKTYFARQQLLNQNRKFHFSKAEDRGLIDSLDLKVEGISVAAFSEEGFPDIARIDLPKPLIPGAAIRISTPFRVKIPVVFSRMGHWKEAYYISQWIPKPAVYDASGWHPMPYADQGEFYSEIGSYDVSLTIPKNYVVMATGNCLDETENAFLDSLSRNPLRYIVPIRSNPLLRIDSPDAFPPSSPEWKTLHFHEDYVHDFAWFADKRYSLKRDSVLLPATGADSGRAVQIWCAYLPSGEALWEKSAMYVREAVSYLSSEVGSYPYKTVKVAEGQVRAGGGMEYPTVTLIDRNSNSNVILQTIVHEVVHNWFYGILANNERDHPWLDEGFTTFYERKISQSLRSQTDGEGSLSSRLEDLMYFNAAATGSDESLSSPSSVFSKSNYGLDVYFKAARMIRWLEDGMGKEAFRDGVRNYYQQWKFRHPAPEDFRGAMKPYAGNDIEWFFDGALKTRRGVDFGLKPPRRSREIEAIRLKNGSDFAAPVRIEGFRNGTRIYSHWIPPFTGDTVVAVPDVDSTTWKIGTSVPDFYGLNDVYNKQAFLKGAGAAVHFGIPLKRSERFDLSLLPAIGFNVYDQTLIGAVIHNLSVPQHRFRFALMPMYGVGSKSFVGAGSVAYWLYPRKLFQEIVPQLDVKSFHSDSSSLNVDDIVRSRYIKMAPSLTFEFRNRFPGGDIRRVVLKGYGIGEEQIHAEPIPGDTLKRAILSAREWNSFALLRYQQIGEQHLNPYRFTAEMQLGPGFCKMSVEGNYTIPFDPNNRAVYLRGFAGRYLETGSAVTNSRYWLASSFSGANDYLYDGTYFGRNTTQGFVSRQLSVQEGGGRMPADASGFLVNRSNAWLLALNVKTDIPHLPLPLRVYADITSAGLGQNLPGDHPGILYSAGFEVHAVNDIFLLHVPVVMSQAYYDYLETIYPGQVFWNSISFSIQLQNINWLRSVSTAMQQVLK